MPPVSSRTTTKSTPCSSSALIGEACSAASWVRTGRRLAYRPSALRIASRPCSGRTLAFGSDHFGPPTAPSSTALAAWHAARVDAGSGSPWRSMAIPPMSCSLKVKVWLKRLATAFRTATAAAATSGPMPSPGRTTISACMLTLVTFDFRDTAQQITQLIDAFQQAGLREAVQREGVDAAIGRAQLARRNVDGQLIVRALHQQLHVGLVQ